MIPTRFSLRHIIPFTLFVCLISSIWILYRLNDIHSERPNDPSVMHAATIVSVLIGIILFFMFLIY